MMMMMMMTLRAFCNVSSGVFIGWTYKNQIWHKGSRGRSNHLFQILSKSVKGFPGCEEPKMWFSLYTTGRHCRAACHDFMFP